MTDQAADPKGYDDTAIRIEDLPAILHQGQRVLTTEVLAAVYGTDPNNIQVNHARNRDRFLDGKHFFKIEGADLERLRLTLGKAQGKAQISSKARSLILWTARGAARHAKMLETDAAWEMFEKLEEAYFARSAGTLPRTGQATAAPERAPRTIAIVCDGDAPGFVWRERVRIDLDCPRLDPGEPAGVIHPVTGAVVVRRLAAPWTAAGHPDRLGLAHFPGPENHSRGCAVQVVVVGAVRRDQPARR